VRISGGGRCNVTHACFDPALLVKNYPRGHQELRGPYTRFQPRDTIQWFESRGVQLKTEDDGRMFPTTDSSETIIHCLMEQAKKTGVIVLLEHGVEEINYQTSPIHFSLRLSNDKRMECDRLLLATGSHPKIYPMLEHLGHSIVPLVPSLFTFNLPQSALLDLSGISLPSVEIKLPALNQQQIGPILLTHWGISGPAVLKLSAWGARTLHEVNYRTDVVVNWLPAWSEQKLKEELLACKKQYGNRKMDSHVPFEMPKQLWKRLIHLSGIPEELRWSAASHVQLQAFALQLQNTKLRMEGKTTYKQEFVTCGGVSLDEINWKKMESKKCPGLFFAGEIIDVDGVTGGFNFQNAWTTGWIAGQSMGFYLY
jgi:predicted Rossmann fold flavoprotein